MTMSRQPGADPRCDKVLLVQAEFDGELDAAQAARLGAHRAACPVCQAAAAELTQARELCRKGLYEPTPDAVRRRVMNAIEASRPAARGGPAAWRWRSWRQSSAGFALGAACAAGLALAILSPGEQNLAEQVVAAHVRALQPGHLEDVASSDRHTVKPWFDGRIDFAPPVKELAAQGFPLKGGRLDYLAGRPVAALVYQRDKHVINLFVWAAASGSAALSGAAQHGYNAVHWVQDGMAFWAVSDVERDQLQDFAAAWQRTP